MTRNPRPTYPRNARLDENGCASSTHARARRTNGLWQCCQMAISIARFSQIWLNWDPSGYFILFLAMSKILAIFWLFQEGALKLNFFLIESLILPQNSMNLVHVSNRDKNAKSGTEFSAQFCGLLGGNHPHFKAHH